MTALYCAAINFRYKLYRPKEPNLHPWFAPTSDLDLQSNSHCLPEAVLRKSQLV